MPFKLNQDHRQHIPKQKRKVTNWRDYDASLLQRGSLTIWFTAEAVEGWRAAPRTTPGGQQGTLTRLWARKGSRPPAPRDRRYAWAYLFGAACPARHVGAGLVLPHANAGAMMLHLGEISRAVAPGAHAVVVLDGAGWHKLGGRLRVPDNISLLPLPPYSPEPNPVENVWQFLRQNQLSNRVFAGYDAIVDACCSAWNALMAAPDRIASITNRPCAAVNA